MTTLDVGMSTNDRMLALLTGEVAVEGATLRFDRARPSEIFWRALKEDAYDVTEMSLAAHVILTARGTNPFVGLPVFTSRMFRHGSLFVSARSAISEPAGLSGRRVGVPEYQMTAAVWMRGILDTDYGVAPDSIHWLTGGVNRPGREERIPLDVPARYRIENIGRERTLDAMLLAGEIDAIMSPEIPQSFVRGDGTTRRLFADPKAAELDYFARTGLFPVMHLVAVRRSVYARDRSLARRLQVAFEAAKHVALERLYDGDALYVMLPWLVNEIEATREVFGADPWPYGVEPNRPVLEAFVGHLHRQGMIPSPLPIETLFAPELLS